MACCIDCLVYRRVTGSQAPLWPATACSQAGGSCICKMQATAWMWWVRPSSVRCSTWRTRRRLPPGVGAHIGGGQPPPPFPVEDAHLGGGEAGGEIVLPVDAVVPAQALLDGPQQLGAAGLLVVGGQVLALDPQFQDGVLGQVQAHLGRQAGQHDLGDHPLGIAVGVEALEGIAQLLRHAHSPDGVADLVEDHLVGQGRPAEALVGMAAQDEIAKALGPGR